MTMDSMISAQLCAVAWASAAGMICGALYDIFREIRWKSGRKWVELLLDAGFSVTAAIFVFLVVTSVTQLRLRGFVPVSMALGWLTWNFSIGRWFRLLLKKTAAFIRRIATFPYRCVRLAVDHLNSCQKEKKEDNQ